LFDLLRTHLCHWRKHWRGQRSFIRPRSAIRQAKCVGAALGYKNEKGAFPVTLAALRKYGLVSESETDKGQEQLTDLAFRLIVDQPESDAWKEAVKKAALNPKLHSELWEKYGADLPSDESLRTYLIFDKSFNEGSVPDAINNYRQSIEFAKLKTVIRLRMKNWKSWKTKMKARHKNRGKPAKPIKKVAGMSEPFAFPLADGVAYLQVPEN